MRTSCIAVCLLAATASGQARVGVYDSRVVAYAHFWSPAVQQEHHAAFARARRAKAAGDAEQFERVKAEMRTVQRRSHFEVFGTAPAAEAMCAIKDRLPEVQREAGVDRVVSKWDVNALRGVPPQADRIDVTDRLVREFLPQPTERQHKTIESIKAGKPLPMWQVSFMNLLGAL